MANPQEEPGEVLMGAALRKEPADFVVYLLPPGFNPFDPVAVGLRSDMDQGRDHPDLSVLGPGDKRVLFA
jgi:hypothetical protein